MSNFIVAEYDVPTVAKWIVNRPEIRIDDISTKSVSSNVAFSTLIPPSSFSEATNQPFPVIASTVAGEFLVPVENAGACTRKRMNFPEGIFSANNLRKGSGASDTVCNFVGKGVSISIVHL